MENIFVGFDHQGTFKRGDLMSLVRAGLYSITCISGKAMKGQIVEKIGIMALDKRYRDAEIGKDRFNFEVPKILENWSRIWW